jgi:hypothetical protein
MMDAALLGPIFGLAGVLIGGGTSLLVSAYTQRNQDRLQRIANEISKREAVYSEFIMNATNLLLHAYVEERDRIALHGDEQRLIGLINRMRLFASSDVIREAEAVLKSIIEVLLRPGIALGQLAEEALAASPDPDTFLRFCHCCRADLESVRRTMV